MSDDEGAGGGAKRGSKANSLSSIFPDAGVRSIITSKYGTVTSFNDEIMRETGFSREADAFDLRVKALTDAEGYKTERNAALKSVGATVQKAYQQTYQLYRESGESDEESKAAAKSAGMAAKQLGMKQFHVRFPDSDVQVYTQQQVKQANQFVR
jgi:hypothetical protein